jgi:hypothetical protein
MSYSFDTKQDRWSDLSDTYQSMIDELNQSSEYILEDVFIPVDSFDVDEVL